MFTIHMSAVLLCRPLTVGHELFHRTDCHQLNAPRLITDQLKVLTVLGMHYLLYVREIGVGLATSGSTPHKTQSLDTDALRWRHNGHAGVSNHQPHGCLLNRLFRRKSKKTSKLRVTGLCAGNSPGTGEFPAQMASYAENVSIWWRHHGGSHENRMEKANYTLVPSDCAV